MFGRAARFYGWSHEDMMNLPVSTLRAYAKHIQRLEAAEDLRGITVACAPQMQQRDRANLVFELKQLAFGRTDCEVVTLDQLSTWAKGKKG